MSDGRPVRVAIVGSGPAGAFTAAELGRRGHIFAIDLFDRLPTPWGLLRGGVAPDHGEIKALEEHFDRQTFAQGARFIGNVEVGVDISHEDLADRYEAIVYATGARTNKQLGIPGEELAGSLAATSFVGWYNSHPDQSDLDPDLSHETAVVIGNGNVAADVARILVRDVDELARSEINDRALAALRESNVRRVVVLGRRGPAQAAFTCSELRHLGRLSDVDPIVDPGDLSLDPISESWLADEGTFTAQSNVELLREYAGREVGGAGRQIEFRFFSSPVALRGADRVEAIEIARTELVRDAEGMIRSVPIEGQSEVIECGLVLRSVGYLATPLPGVPFDERSAIIPNDRGRVIDGAEPVPGVYTVGWGKRGPVGVLGTNKRDASETVEALVEDLEAGRLPSPSRSADDIAAVIADSKPVVTLGGWRSIDGAERSRGAAERRPRVKLHTYDDLLRVGRTEPPRPGRVV
jgi:ferredoxin/flavodoxin---NADP+ reductase